MDVGYYLFSLFFLKFLPPTCPLNTYSFHLSLFSYQVSFAACALRQLRYYFEWTMNTVFYLFSSFYSSSICLPYRHSLSLLIRFTYLCLTNMFLLVHVFRPSQCDTLCGRGIFISFPLYLSAMSLPMSLLPVLSIQVSVRG